MAHYGQYNESLKYFDNALAIDQNFSETWQVKGITIRDWGKSAEAAECQRRAAELDPRYGR